jgi:predicted O-methyltransferase YrrM
MIKKNVIFRWRIRKILPFINGKVIAEVGTYKGDFLNNLLGCPLVKTAYAVDSWEKIPVERLDQSGLRIHRWGVLSVKRQKINRLKFEETIGQDPRVRTLFMDSIEASKIVKDHELDLCYIDADHSYAAVTADLEAWWPKVKPGGVMCGHDYNPVQFGTNHVRKAVNDFVKRMGLQDRFHFITADQGNWFIAKLSIVNFIKKNIMYRWRIRKLIHWMGARTIAEVGVYQGGMFKNFIQAPCVKKAYAVDLWENIPDFRIQREIRNYVSRHKNREREGFSNKGGVNDPEHQKDNREAFEKDVSNDKRVNILWMDSLAASLRVRNEELDFCYIDADHSYEAAKADIEAWWPKVREGGVLSGHDYVTHWQGVKQAVDEFVKDHRLEDNFCFFPGEMGNWFIVKP